MRKLQRQVVLLKLIEALAAKGSWCGETHVQKATFFLQEAVRVPLGFEFVLYKHGPFSFDLRQELGEMRSTQLIDVRSRPAPYGPSLDLSAAAARLTVLFPKTSKRYQQQIEFVAGSFNEKDVLDLERLGTALYVTRKGRRLSPDALAAKIVELKPHISEADARNAVAAVDKLLKKAPVWKR